MLSCISGLYLLKKKCLQICSFKAESRKKALLSQTLFYCLLSFVCRSHRTSRRWIGGEHWSLGADHHKLPSESPPPVWSAEMLWEQDSSWDACLSLLRWCVNRAGADRWASANWSRWPFNPTVQHSPHLYKKMQWNSKEIIILYVPGFAADCGWCVYRIHKESAFPGSWSSIETAFC